MRVTVDVAFEAAHRLPAVPEGHKCSRLHGHNYKVRIEVNGECNPITGWVADFAVIEAYANAILLLVDHRYLNEVPGLENPTAEVIAAWFLASLNVTNCPRVTSVTVWETDKYSATATQNDPLPRHTDNASQSSPVSDGGEMPVRFVRNRKESTARNHADFPERDV